MPSKPLAVCSKGAIRRVVRRVIGLFLLALGPLAHSQSPNLGFMQLPQAGGGNVTVFYPSTDAEAGGVPPIHDRNTKKPAARGARPA